MRQWVLLSSVQSIVRIAVTGSEEIHHVLATELCSSYCSILPNYRWMAHLKMRTIVLGIYNRHLAN